MTPRLAVVVVAMLGAGVVPHAIAAHQIVPATPRLAALPLAFDAWTGRDLPRLDADTEATLGADAYVLRTYVRNGVPLTLFVAYYATQASGRAPHSPLNCLPGTGWMWTQRAEETIDGADRVTINSNVAVRDRDQALVYYWYQSRGRVTANEYTNRLRLIRDSVTLGRSDDALMRVTADVGADRDARAFVAAAQPILTRYLPE
jgi:EpsI family protein